MARGSNRAPPRRCFGCFASDGAGEGTVPAPPRQEPVSGDGRRDLVTDLGREQAVSAQQMGLVEIATRTKLDVDHLDAFLMEQGSAGQHQTDGVFPVLNRLCAHAPFRRSGRSRAPCPGWSGCS